MSYRNLVILADIRGVLNSKLLTETEEEVLRMKHIDGMINAEVQDRFGRSRTWVQHQQASGIDKIIAYFKANG